MYHPSPGLVAPHLHEVWPVVVLPRQTAVVHDVLVSAEVFPAITGIVAVLPGAVHEGLLTELHQQMVLQEGRERGGEGRGPGPSRTSPLLFGGSEREGSPPQGGGDGGECMSRGCGCVCVLLL